MLKSRPLLEFAQCAPDDQRLSKPTRGGLGVWRGMEREREKREDRSRTPNQYMWVWIQLKYKERERPEKNVCRSRSMIRTREKLDNSRSSPSYGIWNVVGTILLTLVKWKTLYFGLTQLSYWAQRNMRVKCLDLPYYLNLGSYELFPLVFNMSWLRWCKL